MQRLGWLDSYQALTVPFLATAFGTFLLRQAFLQVPQDLRDAAALDGYGHLGLPLGRRRAPRPTGARGPRRVLLPAVLELSTCGRSW